MQVRAAKARLVQRGEPALSNVVVMGIGEPLHNYDALMRAIGILNASWGGALGARRIIVSTSGVVEKIRRLAGEPWSVGLALSLHAAHDSLRRRLVPGRGIGSIEEILAAGRFFHERKGRRVTIEYCLLEGLNDAPAEAIRLAGLLSREAFKVNLIPYNPVVGLDFSPSRPEKARRFLEILEAGGLIATLRRARGDEVSAACGQLRMLESL